MTKLVIKKHRPFEIVLAAVIFSSIFSVIVWLLLDANHWDAIKNRLSQSEESRLLWEVNQGLEAENKQLRKRVIMLERSTQIDNQVAASLQNEIQNLQDQTYQLKGELEFYQGIMSATTDSKGLNIQGLHIEATEQERLYRFKLVLTNVAKSDKVVEVTMDMSVEGMNEAGSRVLSLDEVIAGSELKREIKFKNFERIEGSLNFPIGFKPLRVVVDLRQKGLRTTVQKIFEWSVSAS
jgi:predicted exporter